MWELLLMVALMTPCETEDSTNCTWNAEQVTNMEGESYTDVLGIPFYHK